MIIQNDIKFSDYLSKKLKVSIFNCFYCVEAVSVEDLMKIDKKLKKMDPETHEFLLDNLPNSNNPRQTPFVHESDLGYNVLNICFNCFKRAEKGLRES